MSKIQPQPAEADPPKQEPCSCSHLLPERIESDGADEAALDKFVPVAPVLARDLRAALVSYFPRSTPFSLLLLHIAQYEYIPLSLTSPLVHQRLRCHASAGLLDQVMQIVRRALRTSDQVLLDVRGTGAALLFPQVEQSGMMRIAERVSYNIHLLQAETIIPPLQYETEITLGAGSYPEPAGTLDELCFCASAAREYITFRPAVVAQCEQSRAHASSSARSHRPKGTHRSSASGIPFMQLPTRLPTRLKQLVPHALAVDLHCAPVGRDHNRLTIAMANPADTRALHRLREATGMAIFPVACELDALDLLLASGW